MGSDPAPRTSAILGALTCLAGAALTLAGPQAWRLSLEALLSFLAACGWLLAALGWFLARRGRAGGWLLALFGLIPAAASPLHLALAHGLSSPDMVPALAESGILGRAAASALLLFAAAYLAAVVRARRMPRSRLFSALALAALPALMVLLLFALPGAMQIIEHGLARSPDRLMQATLESMAFEAELRSGSNAVICSSSADSPLCREVRSCVQALGLVRAEIPAGVIALRDPDAADGRTGACLLLDPATNRRAPFTARFWP